VATKNVVKPIVVQVTPVKSAGWPGLETGHWESHSSDKQPDTRTSAYCCSDGLPYSQQSVVVRKRDSSGRGLHPVWQQSPEARTDDE